MRIVRNGEPPGDNRFQIVLGDKGVEFSTWWTLLVIVAVLVASGWWLL